MRKIGAHVSIAGGLTNAITNIKQIGGNAIQIFAGSPRTWERTLFSQDQVIKFNQLVDQQQLRPVFIHALYLVNLTSDNPSTQEKSRQSVKIDLLNAQQIKAEGVILHIGSHQGRGFSTVKQQLFDELNWLLEQAPNATLILENSAGQQGKIGTLSELAEIFKHFDTHPRLKLCLDTAHLFAAGHQFSTSESAEQLVTDLKQQGLLDRLVCLHVNDSRTELNSKRDIHANLDEGKIGISSLKLLINQPKLQHIPIILEVPGHDAKQKGPDITNINLAQTSFLP